MGEAPMNEYLAVFFVPSTDSRRKHSPGNWLLRRENIDIGSRPRFFSRETLVVRLDSLSDDMAGFPATPK
jgi:hypothetical protein